MTDDRGPDVAALKAQLKRLGEAYTDGAVTKCEYQARLADIEAQIRAKTTATQPTIEDAGALFNDISALWQEATWDERRRLVAPFFE